MSTIAVTDTTFQSDVLEKEGLVLVDFWAPWCGPCKTIAPALDEISEEMSDLTVAKVDIDDNPDTPGQFGVRAVPTLMLFKNGEPISTKMGADTKAKIMEWVKESATA